MTNMPERVARALCRLDGHPENATMDGKPLWQDYLPEARAAIEAMRPLPEYMVATIRDVVTNDDPNAEVYLSTVTDIWDAAIDAALGKEE